MDGGRTSHADDTDAVLDRIVAGIEPMPMPEARRQMVVSHLAQAPLAMHRTGVPVRLRGVAVDGASLLRQEPSLRWHLAKHTVVTG